MNDEIPVMKVGKYAGTPVDQLPNSYLRWMIQQKFPKHIMDVVKRKLEQSDYNDTYMSVSRHAIDMYSKRFLNIWLSSESISENGEGIATFIVRQAEDAWLQGVDISKNRHQDDGIVKEHNGIKWVFAMNENFPDYKEVITVM